MRIFSAARLYLRELGGLPGEILFGLDARLELAKIRTTIAALGCRDFDHLVEWLHDAEHRYGLASRRAELAEVRLERSEQDLDQYADEIRRLYRKYPGEATTRGALAEATPEATP